MEKKRNIFRRYGWRKIIGLLVLLSFLLPIGFVVYRLCTVPASGGGRVKSDYVLMLFQCLLGVASMCLPAFITKTLKLEIPSSMYLMYVIFLYGAIFLGEIQDFYYQVPHWDTILHTFSGAMLGALGFSVVSLLNKEERVKLTLSPVFVAVFAFCFAVTLGVLWEIYEFSFDGLFGINMQKFALRDGTQLVGHAALRDTMKDLIVDCLGALAMSMIGYISLKYKKGWLENFTVRARTQAERQKKKI